jgi:hypothetical protein
LEVPERVLVMIFSYTTPADKLNLMLVCKQFNGLISTTNLMKNIRLVWKKKKNASLAESLDCFVSEIFQTKRCYWNMILKERYFSSLFLAKFSSLRDLELVEGTINSAELAKIINILPNLKKLHISKNFTVLDTKCNRTKLKCKKLQDYSNNLNLIPIFDNDLNLTTLTVMKSYDDVLSSDIVDFIRTQNNLECLDISLNNYNRDLPVDKLILQELFKAILELSKLETLKLCARITQSTISNLIIPTMGIETLNLQLEPADQQDYELTMHFASEFASKMPKLKDLTFGFQIDLNKKQLRLLNDLKFLKKLEISVAGADFKHLVLKNLMSMKLSNVCGYEFETVPDDVWLTFLQNCPLLEELEIEDRMVSCKVWDFLMKKCPNLKCLKIEGFTWDLEEYAPYEFIKSNEKFNVQFELDDEFFLIDAKKKN